MVICGGAAGATGANVCGVAVAAMMFYDCPDLVERLYDAMCTSDCWFMEKWCRDVGPNFICCGTGEDLAFKNGPFISPEMYGKFMIPPIRMLQ